MSLQMSDSLQRAMTKPQIGYSMVWEDHFALANGLAVNPGDRILSIGSAGCNVFNLLLHSPLFIDVIDVSPAQIALIKLKMSAIQCLSWHSFFEFLFSPRAEKYFETLKPHLEDEVVDYFERNPQHFVEGLATSGRLELGFKRFREKVLPELWPEEVREAIFQSRTLDEQSYWLTKTDLNAFQKAAEESFGQRSLSEMRSAEQLKYVPDINTGKILFERFQLTLQKNLISNNFYLHFFLTGRPTKDEYLPPYLQRSNFRALKLALRKVLVKQSSLEDHLQSSNVQYNKMNLSDVFEYMSPDASETLFELLSRHTEPGGRLAYWCLFVPRTPKGQDWIWQRDLSEKLSLKDQVWFYETFNVFSKPIS